MASTLLPVKERIVYKIAIITYKQCVTTKTPLIPIRRPSNSHALKEQAIFRKPNPMSCTAVTQQLHQDPSSQQPLEYGTIFLGTLEILQPSLSSRNI